MAKLIITVGCSCSGKTTWASNFISRMSNSIYTERDEIRQEQFNVIGKTILDNKSENEVTEIEREIINSFFNDYGYDVVIASDTNLSQKYIDSWRGFAEHLGVDFEIKYFDVPLETLLERNSNRHPEDRLPESVIRRQYKRFVGLVGRTDVRPLNVASDKPSCFVFDLDGTVQLMNKRSPYKAEESVRDFPNASVIIVLQGLMTAYPDAYFFAVSGREASAWDVTYDALVDYGIEPDELFMRETGDYRSDDIIKNEIYNEFILPYYNVIAVFDDRDQVVSMVRQLGLHCFQVADGDF